MVGGGVIGICSAYFLAVAGHEVAVIERRASVAEEASFGNAGIIAPGNVAPWASPGMPARILSSLFKPQALSFRPGGNRALWRWLRKCLPECEAERYLRNRERMQRLASYSQRVLHDLLGLHQLEYENTLGVLQLFRTAKDLGVERADARPAGGTGYCAPTAGCRRRASHGAGAGARCAAGRGPASAGWRSRQLPLVCQAIAAGRAIDGRPISFSGERRRHRAARRAHRPAYRRRSPGCRRRSAGRRRR